MAMGGSNMMLSLYNFTVRRFQMHISYWTYKSSSSSRSEVKGDSQTEESAAPKQQKPAWSPCFYYKTEKEVYHYVGQKIVIEEAQDSFAGMIWPAVSSNVPLDFRVEALVRALALCTYLDTHREQLNLVDKAVLELGAGTGLVSIVAALLGAWVTASDLPEVLGNLRTNLSKNTRRCRHTPQVAALSWSHDLEDTHPTSVHRYDYVLAADVVYHHNFLDELLATMRHFCQPGTTVIWANKFRMENDHTFSQNFEKAFHTRLLAEDGDMKIFTATCREEEGRGGETQDLLREQELKREEAEDEKEEEEVVEEKLNEEELHYPKEEKSKGHDGSEEPDKLKFEGDDGGEVEKILVLKDDEMNGPDDNISNGSSTAADEELTGQVSVTDPAWCPAIIRFGRDVYHYVGQDIVISESIDSYGAVMWPAALALCSFLDNNRDQVKLQGKQVLELGAGTGLVTIVASLLGASVTATDLPEVLGNLRANVLRNTRRCRHTPQVAALSWSHDLEDTHPTSVHRYDYVLAADVVYHHNFLDELLATMRHFCQPGTTVIWANKFRMENDHTFSQNFEKAFHTRLLAEDGDMKIFTATCRQ